MDLGARSQLFLLLAAGLPAQGAILDVLDGETLYDGGFLATIGQQWQRRERLLDGSSRAADPTASHEVERQTTVGLQHGLRNDLQIGAAVTWHHVDAVEAAADAHTDGLGDLELLAKYRFLRLDARGVATNFALLSGLSLPTGDDDQTSGGVRLRPDEQPGSGGVDPMLGAAVTHEPGRWRFNAAVLGQLRTDTDGDHREPGDEFTAELAVGNRFWLEPYPGPFLRFDVVLRHYREGRERDHGPLPDSGGNRTAIGATLAFRPRPSLDLQVYAEVPLHEHVDGSQLGHDWQLDLTFGYRF